LTTVCMIHKFILEGTLLRDFICGTAVFPRPANFDSLLLLWTESSHQNSLNTTVASDDQQAEKILQLVA
jgi:hypothetical protein